MKQKTLFLIDGSAIAYRSYFAFFSNPLINSKGQNTSAVFGFLRFLFMIYDNENPDYLAVVFDPKGKTFRHELYKEYKATRQKMPDELREQIPVIFDVVKSLNIPLIQIGGYEADDVIGTLAKTAGKQDFLTYLVSGDKDFMQLVDPNILLYNFKRAGEETEILDAAGVENKIGLPPDKVVDYLGLMGDTSDNVPGVKGVGAKTAVKLLHEFGDLESVLENAEKVSRTNVRENLKTFHDDAVLSKELVTIKLDVPVDLEIEDLKCVDPDQEKVVPLFRDLEFGSLLDRFQIDQKKSEVNYQIIDSGDKLNALINKLKKSDFFVIDLETTAKDPMRAETVGMAFSIDADEGYYIPVHVEKRNVDGSPLKFIREMFLRVEGELFHSISLNAALKPLLENDHLKKGGHNIKYDMLVLRRHGIELKGMAFDTMVASYLINPTVRQHNLDALALEHLNFVKISTSELVGKGKNQKNFKDIEVEKVAEYACEDADITFQLRKKFQPLLKHGNLVDLNNDVELPLIYVLEDIEQNGVSLDINFLGKMSSSMSQKLDQLITKIYELAGEEFNINSTQQLGQILFEKLNLPKKKKTKTGYSTDAAVLEQLSQVHELPQNLLEYRELTKLKSTYVDALPSLVNPETGRLHTSYNQTVAVTGRLSSSDPNLQNIPIRTEMGREIRRAFFTADSDHVILDADYSQIELRVMAHLSQDPVLLEAFKTGEDIHSKTACLVFQLEPDELNAEHRRRAKEINFGIMYGMGVFGLASRLKISNEEAREFIMSYFAQYGKVQDFINKMHTQVEEQGYVTTLLNRRRYIPEINSKNRNIQEFARRTAVNTPIQGTAAEMLKVAMINIWKAIKEGGFQSKMIMQVHDELVFEVPKSEVDDMKKLVKEKMENALALDVPIKAEIGVGANWLEAH